jgi:hypothetical protein
MLNHLRGDLEAWARAAGRRGDLSDAEALKTASQDVQAIAPVQLQDALAVLLKELPYMQAIEDLNDRARRMQSRSGRDPVKASAWLFGMVAERLARALLPEADPATIEQAVHAFMVERAKPLGIKPDPKTIRVESAKWERDQFPTLLRHPLADDLQRWASIVANDMRWPDPIFPILQ